METITVDKWDLAIKDAQRRIRRLQLAIITYRENKTEGVLWPGDEPAPIIIQGAKIISRSWDPDRSLAISLLDCGHEMITVCELPKGWKTVPCPYCTDEINGHSTSFAGYPHNKR